MDIENYLSQQTMLQCKLSLNSKAPFSQLLPQLQAIRQSLCRNSYKEQIQTVLNSGLYKELITYSTQLSQYLSCSHEQNSDMIKVLQQCLWILINLCMDESGRIKELVQHGLFSLTQRCLMLLNYPDLVNSSLQIIGNIMGEQSNEYKLIYLKSPIFYTFYKDYALSFWDYKQNSGEQLSWVLSNAFLCIHKISLHQNQQIINLIKQYLPIIHTFINKNTNTKHTTSNLYIILSNLTRNTSQFQKDIQQIVSPQFINSSFQQKKQIINICGNMASHTDFGVSVILNNQEMMSFLLNSLKDNNSQVKTGKKHSKPNFLKSCGWILSNILAGTPQQIDYLLQRNPMFFNEIYEIINVNNSLEVIKQVMWAISNLLSSSSDFAFEALYRSNILICYAQKFASMIDKIGDSRFASVFMQGIQCFISKINKNPQTFGIQIKQKQVILQTLCLLRSYITQNRYTQLQKTINDLQTIVTVDQIGMVIIN